MTATRQVVLALGSNVGDRMANLQRGLDVLTGAPSASDARLTLTAASAIYQTAPVGGPEQDDFYNVVVLAQSALPAREILARCAAAEAAAGRIRTVRWGPRTLDVDIIACDSEVSDDPVLTLPHPRAHERAFVLAPWLEVDPQAVLPGYGPVAVLLAAVGTAGVRRRPDLRLTAPAPAEAVSPCS